MIVLPFGGMLCKMCKKANEENNNFSGDLAMNRYSIICPDCRTQLTNTSESEKICPTCNKDVSNSYEIFFQPGSQNPLARKAAIGILFAFMVVIIIMIIATFF